MQKDLLAPPTLSTRKYGWIVCAYCAGAVALGGILAALDWTSVGEWLESAAWIVGLNVTAVLLYRRLMASVEGAKPERLLWLNAARSLVVIWAAYCAYMLVLGWVAGLGSAWQWWLLPFSFGVLLMRGGMERRVGDSLHCAKCEYEFHFADAACPPLQCPECGAGWLGHLKRGRREKSPKWIAAGLVIVAATFMSLNPLVFTPNLAPHLPTPVLWASLYLSPSRAYSIWEELAKRPLNEEWIRTIAERALAERAKNSWNLGPSTWMESMAVAGKMPDDLMARFYGEGFVAELSVPDRVKAGEKFPARLRVTHLADEGGSHAALIFGGYTVGDSTQPVGRGDEGEWMFKIRPVSFSRYTDIEEQPLKAEQRGKVRVHAVYWLVYMPSFWPVPANWQADGTAAKPRDALWFQRVELEKFVQVE